MTLLTAKLIYRCQRSSISTPSLQKRPQWVMILQAEARSTLWPICLETLVLSKEWVRNRSRHSKKPRIKSRTNDVKNKRNSYRSNHREEALKKLYLITLINRIQRSPSYWMINLSQPLWWMITAKWTTEAHRQADLQWPSVPANRCSHWSTMLTLSTTVSNRWARQRADLRSTAYQLRWAQFSTKMCKVWQLYSRRPRSSTNSQMSH